MNWKDLDKVFSETIALLAIFWVGLSAAHAAAIQIRAGTAAWFVQLTYGCFAFLTARMIWRGRQ